MIPRNGLRFTPWAVGLPPPPGAEVGDQPPLGGQAGRVRGRSVALGGEKLDDGGGLGGEIGALRADAVALEQRPLRGLARQAQRGEPERLAGAPAGLQPEVVAGPGGQDEDAAPGDP